MKVLMLNNLYTPNFRGGAERSVQLLAEALVRSGVEVTVVTTDERGRERKQTNGVNVVTLSPANLHWAFGARPSSLQWKLWHLVDLYNPIMGRRLAAVLRAERPDVVHTNNLQGISIAAWVVAAAEGVPVLHTLRDYYLTCARSTCFRAGRNCARVCLGCMPFSTVRRSASRIAEGVVGTSRFILERHLGLGFFAQASFRAAIYNSALAAEARKKRGDTFTFGYLGRLDPSKGVAPLLRAFAGRTDSCWQLLIAGAGPVATVEELRREAAAAKRSEQIHFVGWVDADDFLGRVDVLIVPSLWHEPLSRVAIEAQSHGIPAIVSRRGGLPEIIDDGNSGLVFEPDDPESLPAAIDRLLNDAALVSRLSEGAFEQSRCYRPERVAAQYAEAYGAVIANTPRPRDPPVVPPW